MKRLGILLISATTFFLFVVLSAPAPTQAQTATPTTACTTPAQPTGVTMDYPSCVGTQCNFTQALCSWNAVTGASSYNVTFTNVDTNTVVQTQTVQSGTTQLVFPVNQGKTYKCDVSAVNSCGTAGPVGSYSLLCQTNGLVSTTTPAVTTVATAGPALPASLPSTGNTGLLYAVGIGSFALILLGGMLFLL